MERRISKKAIRVEGLKMAYVEAGGSAREQDANQSVGGPVVFLHGNPTSSYLWRNMVGPLSARYRCLAPDLIGMGDSDKLPAAQPDSYSFATNRRFLDAWFEAVLPQEPVVLVVHDWGSALGFDWARRNPGRVLGIAYMEAIVGAIPLSSLPPAAQAFFRAIRSPAGENMVREENIFLERMLTPEGILGALTDDDRAEYRRPFLMADAGRWPTLSWPRQLPYDGEPAEICAVADAYRAWLTSSNVPKLFINAEPGRLLVGELRELCRTFPNQREVTVRGLHYPQEDSPMEVAAALRDWLPIVLGSRAAAPASTVRSSQGSVSP